jgi:hypothetical protein
VNSTTSPPLGPLPHRLRHSSVELIPEYEMSINRWALEVLGQDRHTAA